MAEFMERPWRVYWNAQYSGEADGGIVYDGGVCVARAPRFTTESQWRADARLMASAPDLYEAVVKLLDRDVIAPEGFTSSEQDEAIKFARAALAKARGEDGNDGIRGKTRAG